MSASPPPAKASDSSRDDSATTSFGPRYSQSLRWTLVISALGLLAASAFVAYRRPLAPIPTQRPRITTLAWWDTPLEINAAARLPLLDGTITAMTRSQDGRYVFLLGAPNLLLRFDRHTDEWLELPRLDWPIIAPAKSPDPESPKNPGVDPRQYPTDPNQKFDPPNAPLLDDPKGKGAKGAALPSRRASAFSFLAMTGGLQPIGLAQTAPPSSPPIDLLRFTVTPNKPTRAKLVGFSFADANHGLLQFHDRLMITRDGGATWETRTSPDIPALSELTIESDGTLLAIGRTESNRLIFARGRSTPEGVKLQELKLPDPNPAIGYSLRYGWLEQNNPDNSVLLYRVLSDGNLQLVTQLKTPENPSAEDLSPAGVGFFLAPAGDEKAPGNVPLMLHVADHEGLYTWPFSLNAAEEVQPDALLAPDAKDLWLIHSEGKLARSSDGGLTWSANFVRDPNAPSPGPHVRLPPPWFFLTLVPIAGLLLLAWRLPPPAQRPGIADRLASDKPIEAGEPDYLGFERVALGLSAYLRNRATTPPLTVAITGPWGGGKSSLMNLLRADLEKWGHKPVWFNAWHHETEEHLLAALLEAVRGQAIPGWFQRGGFGYRTRLLWRRGRRRVVGLSVLLIVLAGSLGYLVERPEQIAAVQTTITRHLAQFDTLRRLFALPDPNAGDAAAQKPEGAAAHDAATARDSAGADQAAAPTTANREGAGTKISDTAKPAAFALIASLAGLLASLWKGLRAFGVEPARLLSSRSQRASHSDLQAQTSFRHQFQQQFRDVTAALRPQTMTLFIDDLDRCQPEHAYKVLESVNFLMTSGSCYIVLGLERSRIERGIGVLFKDLAAEEPALPDDPKHETAPQRFARRYLEKLINLEVAVPTPTPDQLADLLRDRVARKEGTDATSAEAANSVRRRAWPAVDLTTIWMLLVPALALLAFMISTSVFVAPPRDLRQRTEKDAAAVQKTKDARGAGKTPTETGRAANDAEKTAADTATIPATFQPGELGPQHFWIVLLFGLGFGALGVWRLSIPPGAETVDSQETGEAMDKVCPLLVDVPGITPRRIKQFINRVRYLSMMRGSYASASPWWTEQIARLRRWWKARAERRAAGSTAEATTDSSSASKHNGTLDDTKLVILGALFEMTPEKFTHGTKAELLRTFVRERSEAKALSDDLVKSLLSVTDHDLKAFNRLRSGVRLSDDAKDREPDVTANGESSTPAS